MLVDHSIRDGRICSKLGKDYTVSNRRTSLLPRSCFATSDDTFVARGRRRRRRRRRRRKRRRRRRRRRRRGLLHTFVARRQTVTITVTAKL